MPGILPVTRLPFAGLSGGLGGAEPVTSQYHWYYDTLGCRSHIVLGVLPVPSTIAYRLTRRLSRHLAHKTLLHSY